MLHRSNVKFGQAHSLYVSSTVTFSTLSLVSKNHAQHDNAEGGVYSNVAFKDIQSPTRLTPCTRAKRQRLKTSDPTFSAPTVPYRGWGEPQTRAS